MFPKLPKIVTFLFILFIILQISSFLFLNLFYLPTYAKGADRSFAEETYWKIPDLQITIPGMKKFTTPSPCPDDPTKTCVPWIGEYIAGIYKYAIGIVGILATVVMMMGGIMWIVAGGNATRVGEAKAWIGASLTGLVLALTSYTILYQINPKLTQFKPIKVETVKDKCGGCPENYICENINPTTGGSIEVSLSGSDYECISILPGTCTFTFKATNKATGSSTLTDPTIEDLTNEKECLNKLYSYFAELLKDQLFDFTLVKYDYQVK